VVEADLGEEGLVEEDPAEGVQVEVAPEEWLVVPGDEASDCLRET